MQSRKALINNYKVSILEGPRSRRTRKASQVACTHMLVSELDRLIDDRIVCCGGNRLCEAAWAGQNTVCGCAGFDISSWP